MPTSDKRQVILKALEKILKDRRLDEVTVAHVAETASVGKGTVYRYFEDKEDLFFQMIQEFLKEEVDDVAIAAASSMPPREKLIRVGETISEHIQFHGQFIRMMHTQHRSKTQRYDPHDMMSDHHKRLERILSQVLHAVEDAGLLRSQLDYNAVLCIYKGMIMERSMRLVHMDTDVPMEQLVDLILGGIGRTD